MTATDANGNTTTLQRLRPHRLPETITDALNNADDVRLRRARQRHHGHRRAGKTTTQTYDTFGRPLDDAGVPKDQAAGVFITTPAPVYDANDNVTTATAPNGAVTTRGVRRRPTSSTAMLAPKDDADDPERRTTYTYDKVGNLLTITEPKGNLTPTTRPTSSRPTATTRSTS